jgi:hypothetical protein
MFRLLYLSNINPHKFSYLGDNFWREFSLILELLKKREFLLNRVICTDELNTRKSVPFFTHFTTQWSFCVDSIIKKFGFFYQSSPESFHGWANFGAAQWFFHFYVVLLWTLYSSLLYLATGLIVVSIKKFKRTLSSN